MPITLKETINIKISNSFNKTQEKPLQKEKEKVRILEMKTKSKKVLRSNG